jgi:hypothetical protein
MTHALLISIFLNIVEGVFLFIFLKQYNAIKKRNTVLSGNLIEMKNYYDGYVEKIQQHISDEGKRQEVTDEEAKKHILDIINSNNAAAAKLHNSK